MTTSMRTMMLGLALLGMNVFGLYGQSGSNASLMTDRLVRAKENVRLPDSALATLVGIDPVELSDSLRAEYFKTKGSAFFYKGLLDSAISNFSSAYASIDSGECTDQFALVANGLAVTLHAASLRKEAVDYYTKALGCVEFRNDSILKLKIYNNLSILNRELGDIRRAQMFLDKAFGLLDPEDQEGLAALYNSRGQNFLLLEEYDSAYHYFEMSVAKRNAEDQKGRAIGLNNLGFVCAEQGRLEKAMKYYQQAAVIREQIGDLYGSASIFINMANLAVERGDNQQARDLLRNAMLLNERVDSPELESRILAGRSKLEERLGNTALALQLLRRFKQMDDSLRADALIREASNAQYTIALTEAENKVKRIVSKEADRERAIKRQRIISFALAVAIAVFIGLLALLLYQLRLLSNLRKTLTKERDEAEKKAKVRRQTLNAVVHELRTPMNAIISLAELIKEEKDINELRNMTDLLQKSSARLLGITNNVLTFSRLEEGSAEPVLQRENISKLLSDICKVLAPQATVQGLDFVQEVPSGIYAVVDRSMVEIVIMNVVGNALKYTREGAVEVRLEEDGNKVKIRVSDTGPGISEKDQKKVFEPFYQSESALSSGTDGSGLGLSISRHYVEQMRGRIWVESKEGEGSMFFISLPKA